MLLESGFAVQSELRKANLPAISGPNALVLLVARRYNVPGSVFQDAAKLAKVAEIVSRLVGQPCTIRLEWDDTAESTAGTAKSSAVSSVGQQRQQRSELMQLPFVKNVMNVLNAQIIRADEGFGTAAKPATTEAEDTPVASDDLE